MHLFSDWGSYDFTVSSRALDLFSKKYGYSMTADNLYTECAYYPESKILVVINNSDKIQTTTVDTEFGKQTLELEPYDTKIMNIGDQ